MEFDDKTSVLNVQELPHVAETKVDKRAACFIVLTGGQAGRMYKLERDQLVIGRGTEAAIRIEDEGVSRKHAEIIRGPEGNIVARDLGSTNGTYCNGQRFEVRPLQDGDKIQIGTTTILKFSYQDSVDEDFQRRQYESATRDALTGIFNKKYFLERLPSELAFAQRHGKSLALALFDIDHFKAINDTHGHHAGDYVLRQMAKIVEKEIRSDDVLSRFGGEEFALIMRETASDAAFIVAERIRRRVEAYRFVYEDVEIPLTISLGVAVVRNGQSLTTDDFIKEADKYLYRAKQSGRNRTECDLLEF